MKKILSKFKIELIVFVIAVLFITMFNLLKYNSLYTESADGSLYLSVAKNFINNLHFIQNVRINEINIIVPPGLSFIYTILLLIGNTTDFIIMFQYIIFGLSCVFFYKMTSSIISNNNAKTIGGLISTILYCLSTAVLYDVASPRFLLTELYTQFILILIAYFLFKENYTYEKKLRIILLILIIGSFIRVVLFSLLVLFAILYLIEIIRKKSSFKNFIKLSILFISLLGINVLINYRETKEIVLFENYSGIPLYQANNPNTSTDTYSSSAMKDFSDDFFIQTHNNNSLTTSQKSKILSAKSKEWIRNNFNKFLSNSYTKFKKMFVYPYNYDFYIFIIGTIVLYILTKKKEFFILFSSFILLMILTSFGLNIYRYSIFSNIVYIPIKISLLSYIINIIRKKSQL